jgi:uroporphyrinogen-III synthase
MADALTDRTIAIAESRELDLFADLLERRGARVLRYPLVRILDAPDPAPVLAWLRDFVAGGCDDLILLTGEGLRRLLRCIEAQNPALRAPFLQQLSRVRKVTRGPKPARALRELGLRPDLEAAVPTTAGVIDALRPLALTGRRVGVQLYGTDPNMPLMDFLRTAGAQPSPVAPYIYAQGASDAEIRALLERMERREVDAIAFTSKAQVERLFAAADSAQVQRALQATAVAAVGPVVADTLVAHGVPVQAMPAESWFMKPLTAELVALLATHDRPD